MTQTFSKTSHLDARKTDVWEVSDLILTASRIAPQSWFIPSSFLDKWTWGEDHISEHLVGCLEADPSFPILIWNEEVIDGCHRVCKALADGQTHIKAIDLTFNMPNPSRQEPTIEIAPSKWCFGDMVELLKTLKYREYSFRHPLDI